MQKTSIVLIAYTLSACSSLDSNSDFVDAVDTIKDRNNFVEIVAKDLTPDFKAIAGPNIMRSTLALTAIFSKNEQPIPESFVSFQVSYFQNYDEYKTVSYNGDRYELKALEAVKNSCNEHCTTTQYVSFPIDIETIEQSSEDGLTFTMTSASKKQVTDFTIPAGYFYAVVEESKRYIPSDQATTFATPAAVIEPQKAESVAMSKPQEMVEYWYQEATEAEKQQFTDWAFQNRSGELSKLNSDSQSITMVRYWFSKADDSQRKQILTWLLGQ